MHIVMGIIGGKAGVYRHHRNLFLFTLLPSICIPPNTPKSACSASVALALTRTHLPHHKHLRTPYRL